MPTPTFAAAVTAPAGDAVVAAAMGDGGALCILFMIGGFYLSDWLIAEIYILGIIACVCVVQCADCRMFL